MYDDKINNEHELYKNAEQDIKEIEYLLYHYNELKNIVNNSSDIKHLAEQLKAKRYKFRFADDDVLDVFMDYCIVYTITSFENKLEISEFVEWIDESSFIHSNWNIDNFKQELERLKELCSAEMITENKKYYALNDFKVGDVAFDTAFAEIRDKKFFDEFGNFIKEIE